MGETRRREEKVKSMVVALYVPLAPDGSNLLKRPNMIENKTFMRPLIQYIEFANKVRK
jgi:hypothetical protein